MFRGSAPAKVDDKGRLKIPTDFRRVLEDRFGPELFVTSILGDSALIYPLAVWEEIENRLAALPSTEPSKRRFLQRVSFYGQQVSLDAQGRFLIPQILRDKAAMSGDVVVSAQLDHLVVWNRERIEQLLEEEPFTEDDLRILTQAGI
ncbi:MAG: division/cell wall cluster transcriptional repressor MraZ [Acidobacteria bacterium]|nr:division/cell wall cluster transcriptional repressor MraZ [Acidobacteriota bacterium]